MTGRSVLATIIGVALVGLLAGGHLPPARAQQSQSTPVASTHPLVGAWLVTISVAGQSPGAPTPSMLTSLVSYHADGNVLLANAGQLPLLPPASGLFFTSGHGRWVATGDRAADATIVSLVLDQGGGLSSTNTVRTTVAVDATGNAYDGTFAIEAVSPDGNPTGTEEGTFHAVRITTEPGGSPTAATPAVATPGA
jgi:hypothetical protein